jgi:hypothetical protein
MGAPSFMATGKRGQLMAGGDREKLHNKAMLGQWIIWGGMTLSVGMYLWIAFLVRAQGVAVDIAPEHLAIAKMVGWGLGPLMVVVACRVRAFMMARYRNDGHAKNNEMIGRATAPVYVARAHTAMVFSLALSEVPVIYGFVLFLLGESLNVLMAYAALSLLANLLNRPKRVELEALAQSVAATAIYTTASPRS